MVYSGVFDEVIYVYCVDLLYSCTGRASNMVGKAGVLVVGVHTESLFTVLLLKPSSYLWISHNVCALQQTFCNVKFVLLCNTLHDGVILGNTL